MRTVGPRRIRPIESAFHQICPELGITLDVNLIATPEVPDFIWDGMMGSKQMDENLLAQVKEYRTGVSGIYSPGTEDGKTVDSHHIWVRENTNLMEMSVSFCHELVHASQVESFGLGAYIALDTKFNATVGYHLNPFELEAEGMAQFICRGQNLFLFEFYEGKD